MARERDKQATEDGEVERDKGWRLSITIDPSIRKDLRIAAAYADMSIGEWAAEILENAAKKAVPTLPGRKASAS